MVATNINKKNSHHSLSTQSPTTYIYDVELVLAGNMHKNMAVLNWLMRSQPSSLETWISYGNTYINK